MEDLKNIIAVFIKKAPEDISASTLINGKAVPGSIMLHRMYAVIEKAGYNIDDYSNINTYGDLTSLLNGETKKEKEVSTKENVVIYDNKEEVNSIIGVDIESIDNLPLANDFREHEFYTNNFSAQEISYCLLKPNPYETFAGLFSAKEAICKVNNTLIGQPFNKINIQHTTEGKPFFKNYAVSISHTKHYSVAVALLNNNISNPSFKANPEEEKNVAPRVQLKEKKTTDKLSVIALVISCLSGLITLVLLCLYLAKLNMF